MNKIKSTLLIFMFFELALIGDCFARGIPTPSEATSSIIIGILILLLLCCMAFNVSWWLYGNTLSEAYPAPVVVIIMFTTLLGFFLGFNFLFGAIFSRLLSPGWGYFNEYDEFIPYSRGITLCLAGLLTIGMAVLLYKDEGRIVASKYHDPDDEEKSEGTLDK